MLNIVSKKYTQALIDSGCDLNETLEILKGFSLALKDKACADIIASPFLSKAQKEAFLLESVGKPDEKLTNFLRLLAHADRILLIPLICDELEKQILADKKEYAATLTSKDELDSKTLAMIEGALAKKLGVKLSIKQELSGNDGIKLSVEDLGVEVSFSKERFSSDLKSHILKAL